MQLYMVVLECGMNLEGERDPQRRERWISKDAVCNTVSKEKGEMRLIASFVCLAFWDSQIQKCKKKSKKNGCTCRVIHLYSHSCFTQIQLYCHCKEYSLLKNACIKISELFKPWSRSQSFSFVFVYGEIQVKQSNTLSYMS